MSQSTYRSSIQVVAVAVGALFLSCMARTGEQLLLRRASFDLSCKQSDLRVQKFSSSSAGVTGCNSRSAYIANCPMQDRWPDTGPCAWSVDTASLANGAPNAPQYQQGLQAPAYPPQYQPGPRAPAYEPQQYAQPLNSAPPAAPTRP